MGENDSTKQGTPPVQPGPSSAGASGSTSTEPPPKTYTESEYQKGISDVLADAGRRHKTELESVAKERDSLKGKIESKDSELKDIGMERDELKKQIDELSSDDPKKFDLIRRDRELRDRERKLNTDISERELKLKEQESSHAERIQRIENTEREIAIWEIAAEYEGSNPEKLKETCDKIKITDIETIKTIAATFWTKKQAVPATPEPPLIKIDSGVTNGGSDRIGDLPPKQWEAALKKKLKK